MPTPGQQYIEYPEFIGGYYSLSSRNAAVEESWNLYVELMESPGARSKKILKSTPGLTDYASTSLSPNRAMFEQNGRAFTVVGFGFFEINSNGTLTQHGTVAADANPAIICSSGVQGDELCICSGGSVYIFDLTANTLSAAIAGLEATFVAYLDGFFLALDTVNQQLRISDYLNGTVWDPAQFRVRATAGDSWVSMTVVHNEIWLFGSQTYEVWYNAGLSPYPFAPIQGIAFNQGNIAPFSMSQVGESVVWLAGNNQGSGQVMLATQYVPQRISDFAIEYLIQQALRNGTGVSDATAFTYQEDGHIFYVLSFDAANMTLVYDHTVSQMLGRPIWHRRGLWNTAAMAYPARFDAWGPKFYCNAFGKNLVGSRNNGDIWRMGTDLYMDQDDLYIRRVRRAPHVYSKKQTIIYSDFELDMEVGVGDGDPDSVGFDPHAMMRYSDDGGYRFGLEQWGDLGKQGERLTRVRWSGLGSCYQGRVFETAFSAPVSITISNAYLRIRGGIR